MVLFAQNDQMALKDERLKSTSEVLRGIKVSNSGSVGLVWYQNSSSK